MACESTYITCGDIACNIMYKNKMNLPKWLNPKNKMASETTRNNWPHWRAPDENGVSMETDWNPKALEEGPKVLWRTYVGLGYSNVAFKDDRLYMMGQKSDKKGGDNIVHCLDSRKGKPIEKYSFVNLHKPQSTPAVDDEYVYTLNKTGIMVCLNKRTAGHNGAKIS